MPHTDYNENNLEEFAPGIPADRIVQPIRCCDEEWELAIQEHDALRAGKHYDLRLGDPETGFSHSWALPKASLPDDEQRVRLAIQQPTHTMGYMDFEGNIESGYGAGDVRLVHRDKVNVKSEPGKIHLSIPDKGDMVLLKKDGSQWIMIKKKHTKQASTKSIFADIVRASFLEKLSEFKTNTDPNLKTRVAPFRKDLVAQTKAPFKIKAPDITDLSKGKSDEGDIV
jgi:hypothetical protein